MIRLTFTLSYRTDWGETLCVSGGIDALGAGVEQNALVMSTADGEHWIATIEIVDPSVPFDYAYIVRRADGSVRREWGIPHHYEPVSQTVAHYTLADAWQDRPEDAPFLSQAMTDCVNRRDNRAAAVKPQAGLLVLRVSAPRVPSDEILAICGSSATLGSWQPEKALRLSDADFPEWAVAIDMEALDGTEQYKFVALDSATGALRRWEDGPNRSLWFSTPNRATDVVIMSGLHTRASVSPHWRGAGTAIPVFSLRSDEDFGVGEFHDLRRLVDWAVATRQTFIQILPINDTTMTRTWMDSYPYNTNSTFALHPLYLRVSELGEPISEARRDYYEKIRSELNALPQIDYVRVSAVKEEYSREMYAVHGKNVRATADYKAFVDRNCGWLQPYAAFCVLRDINGTPDYTYWGEYAVYDRDKIERFAAEHEAEIHYVYYIQYYLDRQMRDAHEYAHSHGVALKGDIPIGISRTSADAWQHPHLFYLDSQAGAPPDDFSVLGQNWGFPTYNWEEMSRDDFAWWQARFCKMAEYFDAYRIDHILGFFRIWQIPMDAIHGLLGVFHAALPFTPEELKDRYDFQLDVDLHTRPYIKDCFLNDFFGEYSDEARERFMTEAGQGRQLLRPEFDTQRKVADYFALLPKDDKNDRFCEGLLYLIDQVLFIEDPYERGKYHPRISGRTSYSYRLLDQQQQKRFDELYEDFYYHRHNRLWYEKAMWKLPPLIDATRMLTCAEDLGMIPQCVPAVIDRLRIIALEIQRMPKEMGCEFGDTSRYPYYSVCTTSTHDMSGIRGWWEENPQATQRYYNNVLGESGEAPVEALPQICESIVRNHLQSPAMLCILPLQDWLSTDAAIRRNDHAEERINVPASSRHYWRYRMHLTLEQLLHADDFNASLRDMIVSSGR